MIPEIGHFALVLALLVGIAQASVPLIGARRNDPKLMGVAESTALAQFGFVAIAFAALTACYVRSDFSVLTVFENSHSAMPLQRTCGCRKKTAESRPNPIRCSARCTTRYE